MANGDINLLMNDDSYASACAVCVRINQNVRTATENAHHQLGEIAKDYCRTGSACCAFGQVAWYVG